MSAIVTDQFRILNASNFIESVGDTNNSYYIFVGLSNPTSVGFGRTNNWDTNTPNPIDNVSYLNHYKTTILYGKRITSANIRRVIRNNTWISGQKYEMYRHDYSVLNPSPITNSLRLYDCLYYVVNSEYKVYLCIDNGSTGSNVTGNASLIEPTHTDLEPVNYPDDYSWKYLFSISPSDVVKFDSTEYVMVPNEWKTSTDSNISAIRNNGDSSLNNNQIKKVYIKNSGLNYTLPAQAVYDIIGDGSGGRVSIAVTGTSITNATVTQGGKNYTYAAVDLGTISFANNQTPAELIPIIPPSRGHGFDIYQELGTDKIMIYSRFDNTTKQFPMDSQFAQVGILKNPTIYDETGVNQNVYTASNFSAVHAVIFDSVTGDVAIGDKIRQNVTGGAAYGWVTSYDKETKVLKYYQDRSLYDGVYNNVDTIGISSQFSSTNSNLSFVNNGNVIVTDGGFSGNISSFTGITTTISNKIINLGITFTNGLAKPEINNRSGDVIYIDNRPTVQRSTNQVEDFKIILEF
jgi:hypothetical protein